MTRRTQHGFTLIEILLVVAIFALIAGIAVPMFFSSFAGAKLRTSTRSVVMAHRYARNLAVLRQRPVAVLVSAASNTLEVVLLTGHESEDLTELTAPFTDDTDTNSPAIITAFGSSGEVFTNAVEDKPTVELLKALDEGVNIDHFESQRQGSDNPDAPSVVVYYPSGLCDGFLLRLRDERGHVVEINADSLTGQVDVNYAED